MDELIERLGFWIDRSGATAVLREVGGGCHPATRSELALWDALEAAREDGWQPMETAPKDGTRVLLWYEWHDLPVVGDFRHGRWWSVHSLGGNLAYPNGMDWEEVVRPTYWRPLPAPPAIDQARGKGVGGD